MPASLSLPPAILAADAFQVGRPLFGNQWLALLAALAGIAVLLMLVALLGRWLAATHPEPPARVVASAPPHAPAARPADIDPAVGAGMIPVLRAVVAETFGPRARVVAVRLLGAAPPPGINLEALMQEWSHEGRRQIYSSHKVR